MFKDWCRNHLHWSDVKDYAIVISSEAPISSEDEYEYGWQMAENNICTQSLLQLRTLMSK